MFLDNCSVFPEFFFCFLFSWISVLVEFLLLHWVCWTSSFFTTKHLYFSWFCELSIKLSVTCVHSLWSSTNKDQIEIINSAILTSILTSQNTEGFIKFGCYNIFLYPTCNGHYWYMRFLLPQFYALDIRFLHTKENGSLFISQLQIFVFILWFPHVHFPLKSYF